MPAPQPNRKETEKSKPKFEIEKKDGGFVVVDENGVVYGPPAKDRKGAEEILKDWKAYFAD